MVCVAVWKSRKQVHYPFCAPATLYVPVEPLAMGPSNDLQMATNWPQRTVRLFMGSTTGDRCLESFKFQWILALWCLQIREHWSFHGVVTWPQFRKLGHRVTWIVWCTYWPLERFTNNPILKLESCQKLGIIIWVTMVQKVFPNDHKLDNKKRENFENTPVVKESP